MVTKTPLPVSLPSSKRYRKQKGKYSRLGCCFPNGFKKLKWACHKTNLALWVEHHYSSLAQYLDTFKFKHISRILKLMGLIRLCVHWVMQGMSCLISLTSVTKMRISEGKLFYFPSGDFLLKQRGKKLPLAFSAPEVPFTVITSLLQKCKWGKEKQRPRHRKDILMADACLNPIHASKHCYMHTLLGTHLAQFLVLSTNSHKQDPDPQK